MAEGNSATFNNSPHAEVDEYNMNCEALVELDYDEQDSEGDTTDGTSAFYNQAHSRKSK